nr:AbgT family transporter [Saprospiraceae bacterium]
RWYERIPHPVAMLSGIIVLATVLSYVLPAGMFERQLVDGRQRVVPGTFEYVEQTPVSLLDMFVALSKGFDTASDIIWIVFASGIMFGILERSKMVENAVGTIVRKLGVERRYLIVVIMTFVFGLLGVAVGYENNIAMVPLGAMLSIALGGDLILAAGMSVGAITVGFGLSPINPYTVGTGHQIAQLPMFSGAGLRSAICGGGLALLAWYNVRYFKRIAQDPTKGLGQGLDTSGFSLSKSLGSYQMSTNNWWVAIIFLMGMLIMLYGIFVHHWYLQEISAVFVMIAIGAGVAARMGTREMSETALKSIGVVAPGAFMVGFATTIKVILEMGHISDTIAFHLSEILTSLPLYASAVIMSMSQCVMNLLIPSGSGQALATLPVMIPVGDLVGLTRQTTILAFQIGDGVTNLMNPTLGGLIAMLSLCRVPFDRWLRYIAKLTLMLVVVCWVFLTIAVAIQWS